MTLYDKQIEKELKRWHDEILKDAGILERASGRIQKQTQKLVPRKVQNTITAAVEFMAETMLTGSQLLSIHADTSELAFAEREYMVLQNFQKYQKAAITQGIGFGMGGILLGLADMPALMSIKIKFLFDTAKLYGYNPELFGERLYLLNVFQLAFSGREYRLKIYRRLEEWDGQEHSNIDWEKFQIEYRDYLDIAKMLQLLPVVGSVAGGTANHKLMNRLREKVMNCYRLRIRKPGGYSKTPDGWE